MKSLFLVPSSKFTNNVHRDVLYGCWCKGNRIGGGTLPPLTLLSVATVLKQNGFEVELIDMIEERLTLRRLIGRIYEFRLVFVLTSTMTINEDVSLLNELKERNPALETVIFGSHPTFMPEECLKKDGIDFIIRKEPEDTSLELAKIVYSGKRENFIYVKGLGFKDGHKIIINEDRPFIAEYDSIPIVDRSLLPRNSRYFNPIIKRYPYTTALTSRGCIGKCSFCLAPKMMGSKLRFWSVEKVIDEIEYLLSLGFKEIYYRDETFTTFKLRNREIFEKICAKKLKFSWICNIRVKTVDREDLRLMKKCGCRLVKIGVESGVQEILDKSRKEIQVSDTDQLFSWCREVGLDTHAHFMFGMPGETHDTLKETMAFIQRIKPKTIDIGVCTPYPGSDLFEDLKNRISCIKDGSEIDLSMLHLNAAYNHFFSDVTSNDILGSIDLAYRNFYFRFNYILRWMLEIKSFRELINLVKSGINVIKFILLKT